MPMLTTLLLLFLAISALLVICSFYVALNRLRCISGLYWYVTLRHLSQGKSNDCYAYFGICILVVVIRTVFRTHNNVFRTHNEA